MTLAPIGPRAWAGLAFRLARIVAIAWIAVLAIVFAAQRKLLFQPDAQRVAPAALGLTGVSERLMTTDDGTQVIQWWTAPAPDKPVVIYFHGNGGNIAGRADRLALLQKAGYGVLMAGYRGYGGSGGSPSEAALIADAKLAYDTVRKDGVTAERIVLFGESLGTGIVVQLAAVRPVAAVVLDSPYTSTADVAAAIYPYIPVHQLMWDQFNSMAHIARLAAPLLVVHGDQDSVVPYQLGQRLFSASAGPKQMITLRGADHCAPLEAGAWPAIQTFIDRATVSPRG